MKKFLILIPLILIGCGVSEGEPPTQIGTVDRSDERVIEPPSGFGSIAFVCHKTVGLYITADDTRATSSITAVLNHPSCTKE
jgi:hypothetical protein